MENSLLAKIPRTQRSAFLTSLSSLADNAPQIS
jgi:hypothetical protein